MDEIDLETTTFGEAIRAVKFSRKVSTLLFVTMLTKEGEKYHDKALGILCEWARSQGTDHLTVSGKKQLEKELSSIESEIPAIPPSIEERRAENAAGLEALIEETKRI